MPAAACIARHTLSCGRFSKEGTGGEEGLNETYRRVGDEGISIIACCPVGAGDEWCRCTGGDGKR
jgi:hypothetical protein